MRLIITSLLLIGSFFAFSQEEGKPKWKIKGKSSFTFSQASLTNWVAGGVNSISLNGMFSLTAEKTLKRSSVVKNLDLGYGVVKQGNNAFTKSDDRINFHADYVYRLREDSTYKLFITGRVDFRTQFYQGNDKENSKNIISDFMAPGYLHFGLGIDLVPSKKISFSIFPINGKFTFVNIQALADRGLYGVSPAEYNAITGAKIKDGSTFRQELGAFFKAKFQTKIFESNLGLFSNYQNIGNIDVNWINKLQAEITKVLIVTFFTELIYDDDIKIEEDENGDGVINDSEIKPRIQFKSILGLGLSFKF